MLYGALEAGGTKMVCAIGNENGEILEQISIPTTTPQETMPPIIAYFKDKKIASIGVACFGPIDLNRKSETYGCILQTPKIPWRGFNMVSAFLMHWGFRSVLIRMLTDPFWAKQPGAVQRDLRMQSILPSAQASAQVS